MNVFSEISLFNQRIGNKNTHCLNSTTGIDEAITSQISMIRSELNELETAINEGDLKKTRDGIADVIVTTGGLAYKLNLDAERDTAIVCVSNNTKFCHSMEEALQTAAKYEKLKVQVSFRHRDNGVIAVLSAKNQTDINGEFYEKDKLLKSVNYQGPEFD